MNEKKETKLVRAYPTLVSVELGRYEDLIRAERTVEFVRDVLANVRECEIAETLRAALGAGS